MERLFNFPVTLTMALVFILAGCAFASGSNDDIEKNYDEDVTLREDMEGRNVRINAEKNLNTENRIEAKEDADLKSRGNTHIGGTIRAGRVQIRSGGNVKIDGTVTGGDININSGGDIDLSNTIHGSRVQAEAGRNMNVDANITGEKGVDLTTQGEGRLWVKEGSLLNAPEGKVNLHSKNLQMEGTIRDAGDGEEK